jgi:hypothetical protein
MSTAGPNGCERMVAESCLITVLYKDIRCAGSADARTFLEQAGTGQETAWSTLQPRTKLLS